MWTLALKEEQHFPSGERSKGGGSPHWTVSHGGGGTEAEAGQHWREGQTPSREVGGWQGRERVHGVIPSPPLAGKGPWVSGFTSYPLALPSVNRGWNGCDLPHRLVVGINRFTQVDGGTQCLAQSESSDNVSFYCH